MEQRPTKKQKELLSFIDGFIKGNGYGPSYREIMRALDYKSVSTVATHVDGLIARGWLIKKDNSARTLEVVHREATHAVDHTSSAERVEREILAKIDELQQDKGKDRTKEIETLVVALEILGYHAAGRTEIV